ncbi:DUF397 domain-containing protein [Streptomyces coelicoflavus]|uniref:DUF397 domain-containing protein n=1 Tax=Streptomyces coelicoflavus TaxID=285562 RepID=UPI0002475854|nr:DNA-binding protein [Streptomyces coelicoflavus ZG0656]MZE44047.1 DUF397 domain-containing protein [Streptomyces sp. SID5477]
MKLEWIKSSYSTSSGPDCVEVATPDESHVLVRDSKNPAGPHLALTPPAWAAFLPHAADR